MRRDDQWISAAKAADLLQVTRATLYAYVSRGQVRSQPLPGSTRERRYSRDDVERLRRRTEERRDPDKAASRTLQWGLPVLESSICLIDGKALYYRGHDAVALARTRSVAEIAALIWCGTFERPFEAAPLAMPPRARQSDADLPFVARAQRLLAAASGYETLAVPVAPADAGRCGWRILHLLTAAATRADRPLPTIDRTLARAWRVNGRGIGVLRAALILCADHELNVSSFTARCVASAGGHPHGVVVAGLSALAGARHGGASARVASMLASMRGARDLRRAIAERLRRGERIEGFGHPLYPGGDPRATALLGLLRTHSSTASELAFVLNFAATASAALGERPNVDFALAAIARVLRLPEEAPLCLFAIGRTIGWIGHAIEQYATGQLIRPRAKYVGVVPLAR